MWQEAKANEKRVKELIADHKRRAERRRAYYESKLGDPKQLLRIIGSTVKLYPNAEQYYYHENTNNLMPWQGDTNIRIDRFDGRSLLDYIPKYENSKIDEEEEDYSDREELNFERYHDLVEAERLNVTEKERLTTVDEEWTKLLDRHKALLAMINAKKAKTNAVGFDYGTSSTSDSLMNDDEQSQESELLYETDILEYVNDLTEKDRRILNEMGMKYGIRNYTRLLRVAKRDRDEELKQLKMKQQNHDGHQKKDGSRKSRKRKRRRRRRYSIQEDNNGDGDSSRYKRRGSPTYGNYDDDDDDGYSDDETDSTDNDSSGDDNQSDFVIEFGSTSDETQQKKLTSSQKDIKLGSNDNDKSTTIPSTKTNTNNNTSSNPLSNEKKLTPMEKLKMKMRAGLQKTIQSDANDKLRKEKERQLEDLQQYALHHDSMNDFNSPIINMNNNIVSLPQMPSIPPKEISSEQPTTTIKSNHHRIRYRSPSSSSSPSPSPERKKAPISSSSSSKNNTRYRSPSTDSASSFNDSKHSHSHHHRYYHDDNDQHVSKRHKHEDYKSSKSHRHRSSSRSRSRHRSPHRKSSKSSRHYRHRSKSPSTHSTSHRKSSSSSSRKRSPSPEKSSYRSSRSYRK